MTQMAEALLFGSSSSTQCTTRSPPPPAKASDEQGLPLTIDLLSNLIDEASAIRRALGNGSRPAVVPGLEEDQAVVLDYKQRRTPKLSNTG